ncbi:penicillin-binding protein activator LpoB [Stutzerimonas stutzeri]|jgi:penicillin-binding protein activator|uniref:penicillin-binding protein activator LpoB n=1 Tax=Stutzerimonas stutzeri TaxID=316 RepID=UPI00147EBBBE|nr:penicillin-binding protein activator LpoB [Stutzerimonas stutzeri]MBW8338424.1 penicillin-binding protein activator LpoB [Pseudomonas sp.]MDH0058318.1 penicillin-binding protein activator LpoB [Stutzerimonas stutzeri]QXP24703.1 penicillin-binding protein activator LpoB [Stutzerimonas stutzeri]WRQ03349.1 penicillin-binding protein activator LpoB [Stutzerimonas stutzeri]
MLFFRTFTALTFAALVSGCASTSSPVLGGGNISYGDSKAVELVTNEFGSSDLQTIAESMTRSLAQSGVLQGRPVIQVYDVKNKTSEYIDTREITTSIKTQLMKTGTARFASDNVDLGSQVEQLKQQNQSGLYKQSTIAKAGNMVAAQYRLEGSISSIVKRSSDYKDVFYKFSLQLVDVESGLAEWMDEKEIRKTTER